MSVTINAKGTSVASFRVGKNGTLITQGGEITPPDGNDLVVNLAEDKTLVIDAGASGPALITTTDDKDLHINPATGGGQYLILVANRWPGTDGTSGQVLTTNGSGILSWATPPGSGTVTSVAATGNNGITVSGSPITTSGTITLGLGDITPTSVSVGSFSNIVSAELVTSTTDPDQVVTTFSATTYRSAKFQIQVSSGSSYQMSEINLIHDDTTVYMTEYGEVRSSGVIASFDSDISGGNVRLLVTPVNAVTTIRVIRIAITS